MNSLVFIKGILGTDTQPALDDYGQLIPNGVIFLNPVDKRAIEAALQLAGENGTVTIASYGKADVAEAALRSELAIGAQQAFRIESEIKNATIGTGIILAEAAKQFEDYDIIFTGTEAIDDAQGTTGNLIAGALDLPYYDNVDQLTKVGESQLAYQIKWEQGIINGQLDLPAVISVDSTINKPRLPSFKTKIAAKRAQISVTKVEKVTLITDNDWKKLVTTVKDQCMALLPERQPAKIVQFDDDKQACVQMILAAIHQQGVL